MEGDARGGAVASRSRSALALSAAQPNLTLTQLPFALPSQHLGRSANYLSGGEVGRTAQFTLDWRGTLFGDRPQDQAKTWWNPL
jgi:hypothetical protein